MLPVKSGPAQMRTHSPLASCVCSVSRPERQGLLSSLAPFAKVAGATARVLWLLWFLAPGACWEGQDWEMVPGAAWEVTGNCSVSGPKKPQPVLLTERARVPQGLFTPGSSHLSWCLKAFPPKATYIPGESYRPVREQFASRCVSICLNGGQ